MSAAISTGYVSRPAPTDSSPLLEEEEVLAPPPLDSLPRPSSSSPAAAAAAAASSAALLPALADFSLNWIMRFSHPIGVPHCSSHASSAWAGTCDCAKTPDREGSTPAARYSAALALVAARRSLGSCGSVMACRSTTQKKASWSSCSCTQFLIAPR